MRMVPETPLIDLRRLKADGRPFKKGDVREDGYIFRTYQKTKITKEGFYKESWLSPKAYERYLLNKLEGSKKRQKRQESVEGRRDIYSQGFATMMNNF